MKHDYYKSKVLKMGYWTLMPIDSENWHGEHTSNHFFKVFGFYKGSLVLHDIKEGLQHAYFPQYYFDRLYKYITDINKKDYKTLSRKFLKFYKLKEKAKAEIPKLSVKNYGKLSNKELLYLYKKNRDWAHLITIYDQFGWTAEDYWEPYMENILVNKLGIEKGSKEYNRVLFILTKPEEISTTLEEKRDVILEAHKVKQGKKDIDKASKYLARRYGWMPVFTYGTPWDAEYYREQLKNITRRSEQSLYKEYKELKDYTKNRNKDVKEVLNKYKIESRDLQLFIDFGLALDTRNEAEYIVSLAGFHILPIYKEISRRFHITIKQLRSMLEKEVMAMLRDELDVYECLKEKGRIVGWGFNNKMNKRINFSAKEGEKLLKHLDRKSQALQGHDQSKGKCASPGKVKGTVRIVKSPDDNDKVKKGDIMVCHGTTVDYLPAMKNASAFVTEVGSLTCHAAVVAREFGVPCIVSLKNATKNFKDNDLVELDADNGTITRIKG